MVVKLFGGRLTIGKELSQYGGKPDDFYGFLTQRWGVNYVSRARLKAYRNAVYDCVSLIAEQVAGYAPKMQAKKGDQWETIDHEFIDLLYNPQSMRDPREIESFSKFDLFEATAAYLLLQGDCFWYMGLGKTTGRPRDIVVLRPDKVGTDVDKTGKINGYFIRQEGADPIPLEVNEVLRFNLFNPESAYEGKSVVQTAADYIETDNSTAQFTKNFFRNNAGLSGVLSLKGEITKNSFKKFVRKWREKYQGVDNAGKVAILRDSQAAFTKVGLGLDELDMKALREMTLDDVFMAFKVPKPLLGKAEQTGLGRGNVEALEYIFAKYNIEPKMKRLDSVLQFALFRYYGLVQSQMRFTHENIIPADKEHDLAVRTAGVDKWLTRDEIRDEDGKDSIPGGDQLFVPINSIPINEASLETAPVSESALANAKFKPITVKIAAKKKDLIKANTNERFRLSLMRNQSQYEKLYRRTLAPIFDEQRQEALTNLEAHGASLTKAQGAKLFDDAAYDAMMLEDLTPVLYDLAETQGGIAMRFAGDEDNEFHLTSKIQEHLQRNTQKMATNFNDETLAALNSTLAEGIQAGEGVGSLKKRVISVYDNVEGYRAERIARTETLKASNDATVEAYRQTGFVRAKEWVVNPGACPQCRDFEGKSVPLDSAFLGLGESYTILDDEGNEQIYTNDYDTIEQPPLHPNCRCTVIPVR